MGYDIVVVSDAHHEPGVPDNPSYLSVVKFVKDLKPAKLVLIGDFADFLCFSQHHNVNKPLNMEGKRYKATCDLIQSKLEELRPHSDDMYYVEGNHELWVTRYVERHPEMEGYLDWVRDFKLGDMDITAVPFNEVLTIGKIGFTHGWYINKYHASKHLDMMGDHIFYGHTHDVQAHYRPVRARREPYVAQSIGCLCDRNPSYMRGKPTRWIHGFEYIEVWGDSFFTPHFIPIVGGAFSFNRHIWKA